MRCRLVADICEMPPFRGFFLREWNKTRPRQSY